MPGANNPHDVFVMILFADNADQQEPIPKYLILQFEYSWSIIEIVDEFSQNVHHEREVNYATTDKWDSREARTWFVNVLQGLADKTRVIQTNEPHLAKLWLHRIHKRNPNSYDVLQHYRPSHMTAPEYRAYGLEQTRARIKAHVREREVMI